MREADRWGQETPWRNASFGALCLVLTAIAAPIAVAANIPDIDRVPVESELWSEEMKDGMARALRMTPHAFVVVHTRVAIEPVIDERTGASLLHGEMPSITEERHIYEARVLETLRGRSVRRVRYEVIVDSGDSAALSSRPEIVMLCRGARGFYGAGVGTSFRASRDSVALARTLAKDLATKLTDKFDYCD